jgi:hypothetical protein
MCFLIMRSHDKPRLAAAGLGLSHLLDVGDVPIYRSRRDHVLVAIGDFDLAAIELSCGAVALNCASVAGEAGPRVTLDHFIDGKGKLFVAARRGRPRLVVVHYR